MTALQDALKDHEPEANCYCLIEGWQEALRWVLSLEGSRYSGAREIQLSLDQAIRYQNGDEG